LADIQSFFRERFKISSSQGTLWTNSSSCFLRPMRWRTVWRSTLFWQRCSNSRGSRSWSWL